MWQTDLLTILKLALIPTLYIIFGFVLKMEKREERKPEPLGLKSSKYKFLGYLLVAIFFVYSVCSLIPVLIELYQTYDELLKIFFDLLYRHEFGTIGWAVKAILCLLSVGIVLEFAWDFSIEFIKGLTGRQIKFHWDAFLCCVENFVGFCMNIIAVCGFYVAVYEDETCACATEGEKNLVVGNPFLMRFAAFLVLIMIVGNFHKLLLKLQVVNKVKNIKVSDFIKK